MEKREFTSSIAMLVVAPAIMLSFMPLVNTIESYTPSTVKEKYVAYEDGDVNRYEIDYGKRTVTAYLGRDNISADLGIKQRVTLAQILKIKNVSLGYNNDVILTGDPFLPILEGDHYKQRKVSSVETSAQDVSYEICTEACDELKTGNVVITGDPLKAIIDDMD